MYKSTFVQILFKKVLILSRVVTQVLLHTAGLKKGPKRNGKKEMKHLFTIPGPKQRAVVTGAFPEVGTRTEYVQRYKKIYRTI